MILRSALGRGCVGLLRGYRGGGNNYLPLDRLSLSTWSRRRRWREFKGPVSPLHLYRCYSDLLRSNISEVSSEGGGGGVGGGGGQAEVEVRDDTVEWTRGVEYQVHRHFIHRKDIKDVKVNVGEPVIAELERLFGIPRVSALRMVRSDGFLLVSDTAILRTLYFLKDHGVDPQQILRIPWLLLQSTDSLEQKFQKLLEQYLFLTLSDGLGFSRFSHQQIVKYQKYFAKEAGQFPDYQNRIYYIAGRMEMPVALVTEKIVQPKQMLRMDINRIDYIINIFQKHGVHMRDVVADLWVFCHNVQLTESRLQQAVQAGCVHPKPWICHSSPHVFERYLGRLQSKTLVLGEDGALETYLSDRLDCPLYEVNANFRRNPGLKSVHVSRIKSKLDLLFAEGFTPEDIRRCMRVLQYAEERLKLRIEELRGYGETNYPVSVLYKRPKTYDNIVRRLKKRRRKEEEEEEVVVER